MAWQAAWSRVALAEGRIEAAAPDAASAGPDEDLGDELGDGLGDERARQDGPVRRAARQRLNSGWQRKIIRLRREAVNAHLTFHYALSLARELLDSDFDNDDDDGEMRLRGIGSALKLAEVRLQVLFDQLGKRGKLGLPYDKNTLRTLKRRHKKLEEAIDDFCDLDDLVNDGELFNRKGRSISIDNSLGRDVPDMRRNLKALIKALESAERSAHAVAGDLLNIAVDVSGIKMTWVQPADLDLLINLLWSPTTRWPSSLENTIHSRSVPIDDGLYRITGT